MYSRENNIHISTFCSGIKLKWAKKHQHAPTKFGFFKWKAKCSNEMHFVGNIQNWKQMKLNVLVKRNEFKTLIMLVYMVIWWAIRGIMRMAEIESHGCWYKVHVFWPANWPSRGEAPTTTPIFPAAQWGHTISWAASRRLSLILPAESWNKPVRQIHRNPPFVLTASRIIKKGALTLPQPLWW